MVDQALPIPGPLDTSTTSAETGTFLERAHDWIATVDHKKLGIMYVAYSIFFLLVGGVEAILIRIQLMRPIFDRNPLAPHRPELAGPAMLRADEIGMLLRLSHQLQNCQGAMQPNGQVVQSVFPPRSSSFAEGRHRPSGSPCIEGGLPCVDPSAGWPWV